MIRSVWTFVQDTPNGLDASRVQRSVIRLAVTSAAEATDALMAELTADATRDLGSTPERSGTGIFRPGPGEPFDVGVDPPAAARHTVRVPNGPGAVEALVAVRVCAELAFPDVMDLE